MDWLGGATTAVDAVAHETLLFAGIGFLVGGIDDLAVDVLYAVRRTGLALGIGRSPSTPNVPPASGLIAIFVPAWDEQAVIGPMLRHMLATFEHDAYRCYVGTYPNDRATIDAVADVAAEDPRIRLVIGARPGPTTKADCLNGLWRALERDRLAEGLSVAAIVLHDAEDMVHPRELTIFAGLIDTYDTVQLPVLPLVYRGSRLVAGHYCDEFAEVHGKSLVVRQAVGAAMPLAGVGCAISHRMLTLIAGDRHDGPFDAESLTEDYELGLRIAALGGRGTLARVRDWPRGRVAVVRAYFPSTMDTAVRQKARWMTGIALAGWDRVGWGRWYQLGEHWMRMRDRRAPLAVLLLVAAYVALVGSAISTILHSVPGIPASGALAPVWLVVANAALLLWRLAVRAWFTGRDYGPVEALLSAPRMVVGNVISMFAARRAVIQYVQMLRGAAPRWDKTAHVFPDVTPPGANP